MVGVSDLHLGLRQQGTVAWGQVEPPDKESQQLVAELACLGRRVSVEVQESPELSSPQQHQRAHRQRVVAAAVKYDLAVSHQ